MVVCELGVFAGPEAEVEAQLEQVGSVVFLGVVGVGSCGRNGVNSFQGGIFFLLDWGMLDPVGFDMPGEALVGTGLSL